MQLAVVKNHYLNRYVEMCRLEGVQCVLWLLVGVSHKQMDTHPTQAVARAAGDCLWEGGDPKLFDKKPDICEVAVLLMRFWRQIPLI